MLCKLILWYYFQFSLGHAIALVKPLVDLSTEKSMWEMFSNESFAQISEICLTHSVKMLNIFHHVLNDMVPTIPIQPKTVLSNLPAPVNLSPIKRRKSDLDKKILMALKVEKEDKNEKKDISKPNSTIMSITCSSRYMRIFEILKTAFINYKVGMNGLIFNRKIYLLLRANWSL